MGQADFADYRNVELPRSGVERQFGITGQALSQIAEADPRLAEQIPEYRRIVAFRNLLIQGYANIDDRLVWGILESKLPTLAQTVEELLANP